MVEDRLRVLDALTRPCQPHGAKLGGAETRVGVVLKLLVAVHAAPPRVDLASSAAIQR
ncbi:Uncharacterised protein [Mycobacteroides abscessus subsp. abscessus]|nr:Uncharacterised protein [Mycobacteroides abscessus subsp. abscessus]